MRRSLMIAAMAFAVVISTSVASAQDVFQFFTAKEGLDSVKSTARELLLPDPDAGEVELMAILWKDIPAMNISGAGLWVSEMKYDAGDVGKANMWMYAFRDKDNYERVMLLMLGKVGDTSWIVVPNPMQLTGIEFTIDENEIVDSDVFVSNLMLTSNFVNSLAKLEPNKSNHTIGLTTVVIGQEKLYWISAIAAADQNYYCFAEPNTGTPIECLPKTNIVDDFRVAVNISPNPANNLVSIELPDDIRVSNLELFDINGNLVRTFDAEQRNLNLSAYSSGKYYLCFTANSRKYYHPIILHKI